MPLDSGTRLGPYILVAPLGAGGMGEVYRAKDTRLGREVALKVLPAELTTDRERRARFEGEAKAASSLNHPGIVTVHDFGDEGGVAYLVTELVEGTTLREARPEGLRRQLDVAAQTADAIAAAHAAGITHRDLKPENIMVTHDGRAKILDFGLARRAGSAQAMETVTAGLTGPGMVMGTLGYMSPEQARGMEADARSDIFSFGAVLYELFTGKRAFVRETAADSLIAILQEDPAEFPESLPGALGQVVRRCLEKEPSRRFQSASDLGFALRTISMAGSGATAMVAAAPRRWNWALVATGAVALLGLLTTWRLATERQMADMSEYRFRPFATEAEGEGNPSWSPDGKSIAYTTAGKLVVKGVDGSAPLVVGPSGVSRATWRADSSGLIVVTRDGKLLAISRAGGEPTVLAGPAVSHAAALSPDGKSLAAIIFEEVDGKMVRSVTVSAATRRGEQKRLFRIPASVGVGSPNYLQWSPNGRQLLLSAVASPNSGLWVIDAESGAAKRLASGLTAANFSDFSWMADSRHALVSFSKPGSITDRDLWLVDTRTAARIPVLLGVEGAGSPTVSPDGKQIAFVTGEYQRDLLELPLDGSAPRNLLATATNETAVAWSPAAPEYVYARDNELRIRKRDGSSDRALVHASDFSVETVEFLSPAISPDGTRVVYTASTEAGRRGFVSPLSGGAPTPVGDFAGTFMNASWSPDGKWIAFVWDGILAKVRVGSPEAPVVVAKETCRFCPSWSPDGSRILCGTDEKGLYTVAAEGGAVEFLGGEYERLGAWSAEMRYLYVIARGPRRLGRLDWKTGVFQSIVELPEGLGIRARSIGSNRMSLAPDGKSLATSLIRQVGDIWILEGFRGPRSLWERLAGRAFGSAYNDEK